MIRRQLARISLLFFCGVALMATGCAKPGAPPTTSPLMRGLRFAPLVPDEADHAAADLAAAALVAEPRSARRALARLRAVETRRSADGEDATGLLPLGLEMMHATIRDERAHQAALLDLLERGDLDEATRTRLEQDTGDDLLALADARIRDAWVTSAAQLFNAIAEPAGRSLITSSFAPYHFGAAALRYVVDYMRAEPLSLQRRQALAHWKEFLDREPDSPEAGEIEERVAKAEVRWNRTQRNRSLARAEKALEAGSYREALVAADRALRHAPEDAKAERVRTAAAQRLLLQRQALRMSEDFQPSGELLPGGTRALALALLQPDGDVDAAVQAHRNGPLAAEVHFVRASALGEKGNDDAMSNALRDLANCHEGPCTMARHASAELADPYRNAYDGFRRARWRDHIAGARWVLFGRFANQQLDLSVAGLGETLLSLPAMAQTVFVLPFRLIQYPWNPPQETAGNTAVYARRYLSQHAYGEHADEVRDWLEGYEQARGNYVGALTVAEAGLDVRRDDLEALREKAARQALEVAAKEERRDMRSAMLYNVAREFRDTSAGAEAGEIAREQALEATAHHVRISRGFLEENPDVAGPEGLGLEPSLLDGDPSNGELHPEGVTLVGGHGVELSFVDVSGDDRDPPTHMRTNLSDEHLARLVALLEEESFRNSLLDSDDVLRPDAQRDQLFERARLGLASDIDPRATAEARFAYRGLRERYGMVRARESILPFDIVVQGSITDLSLGAFPRMRRPRQTPDAFLYQ